MIIKIQYYEEAKDKIDADATTPHYSSYETSFEDAIAFIGKLEKIEKAAADKAVLDAKSDEEIPF